MQWKLHVTVAAVIERDQRFLVVEEQAEDGVVFNQPAGHLEDGEDLLHAACREVLEETGWQFTPHALVALQLWRRAPGAPSFLRVCFTGDCHDYDPARPLDHGIVATHWLDRATLAAQPTRLRSPLVLASIDSYLAGHRYPLSAVQSWLDHAR